MGAYLSLSGGKSKATIARFLLTRGLVLIFLDLTFVRIAWDFNFNYAGGPWFIVLSTLGVAMIVLAGLIFLPTVCILAFSAVLIAGHNYFDFMLDKEDWGRWEPLWRLLKFRGGSEVFGMPFYITYTLIPWIGIMSLGYAFGPILRMDAVRRRRTLFLIGLGFILTFVVLRAFRLYGDPRPWVTDPDNPLTYLGFLRNRANTPPRSSTC